MGKSGKKVKDLLVAVKDDSIQQVLENPNLSTAVTAILEKVVTNSSTAMILGSIIGGAAPRVNSIILNYKENRFERNMNEALSIMKNRLDAIESRAITEDQLKRIIRDEAPLFLDSLYDERQKSKVKYHVAFFMNSIRQAVDENTLIDNYDTINQLTAADIEILECYVPFGDKNFYEVRKKYNLDETSYRLVREKLARFGLLNSKNEEIRDKNLERIRSYIIDLDRQSKKRNPNTIKVPNLDKTKSLDSYELSPSGRRFLSLINLTSDSKSEADVT